MATLDEVELAIAQAAYPDVHPDFTDAGWRRMAVAAVRAMATLSAAQLDAAAGARARWGHLPGRSRLGMEFRAVLEILLEGTGEEVAADLCANGLLRAGRGPDAGVEPLPRYSDPGRILFRLEAWAGTWGREVEVLDYDVDSCVLWMHEGCGIEYWIAGMVDLELPGTYVLEGVAGEYRCGDGWTTEDDEEYWFALCRRASRAEEETETLDDGRDGGTEDGDGV